MVDVGVPSKPSWARCRSVKSEHGSTPSILKSRGRGGNDNPVGSAGADPTCSLVHPPTSSNTTISSAARMNRP